MLQKKARELERIPKKGDFSQQEVIFIKAHLGPWPRALVAAGLKEKHKPRHYEGNIRRRRKNKRGSSGSHCSVELPRESSTDDDIN